MFQCLISKLQFILQLSFNLKQTKSHQKWDRKFQEVEDETFLYTWKRLFFIFVLAIKKKSFMMPWNNFSPQFFSSLTEVKNQLFMQP